MIKLEHLILARRLDIIIVNKLMNFTIPADHTMKSKGSKRQNKYPDLARELKKKTEEHESNRDTKALCHIEAKSFVNYYTQSFWNNSEESGKKIGWSGGSRKDRDHSDS